MLRSFAPVVSPASRVLILGSMPGAESLRVGQYYAKPGNAFWPIMGALFGAGPFLPYEERLGRLDAAGIGLWDVLATCRRAGSLDAAIRDAVANDFATLFAAYPAIGRVVFNGQKADSLFRRKVGTGGPPWPALGGRLPSTSPAHARMTLDAKSAAWRSALIG